MWRIDLPPVIVPLVKLVPSSLWTAPHLWSSLNENLRFVFLLSNLDLRGPGLSYKLCRGLVSQRTVRSTCVVFLAPGSDLLAFAPDLAPFMKIRATEDGGANPVTVTLWINIQ